MPESIDQQSEAMAAELLSDPAFKAEMLALLTAAVRRALVSLMESADEQHRTFVVHLSRPPR